MEVNGPVTQRSVLDALEALYPVLGRDDPRPRHGQETPAVYQVFLRARATSPTRPRRPAPRGRRRRRGAVRDRRGHGRRVAEPFGGHAYAKGTQGLAWANAGHHSDRRHARAARRGHLQRRWPRAGDRPGGRHGRGADDGLDERGTLRETLESGRPSFGRGAAKRRWRKGDTSGDRQWVRAAYYDCDGDTLLFVVEQEGAGACHTGSRSCFLPPFR